MPIKVLQANVGRGYAAQDMVYATAKHKHIDILVVGEPNRKRVADDVWIKDSRVDIAVLFLNRNLGVCGYKVSDGHLTLQFKDMSMVCCYISPNIPIPDYKKEVDAIMSNLEGSTRVVILGDVNAKSFQWGSPIADEKGTYWTDWISSTDMVVHNTGLRPTFIRGESKSFIDVTISTSNMASKITHWAVLEDESLTEHQYIYFEIERTDNGKRKAYTKPAVDWKAFTDTLKITTTGTAVTKYDAGVRLISEAYKNSIKHNNKYKQDPYWWTDDISEKRKACMKNRRELTRIRKREVDVPAWDAALTAYRNSRKTLNKLIKQSKRECWEKLCAEVENDVWGGAYKIVLKKTGYLTPYEVGADKKRQIVADLFPPGVAVHKSATKPSSCTPFGEAEVMGAVMSLKTGKSPGLDKIPPEAIRMAADCSPALIAAIMNNLLQTNEFPDEWKVARVVLLLKNGKPPDMSSSYRPLCLLNTLSKVFETLIKNRLQAEIDQKGGLHRLQFGFRKNMSTIDAILAVKQTARDFNSRWCVLVTIDVKNAFNTASHDLIVQELRKRNVSSYLTDLVTSYLSNRKIYIGRDITVNVSAGVPQGSVLGPLLWNILYDGVLDLEFVVDAVCVGFADDLALVVGADNEHSLMRNTNLCLGLISTWMRDHRLQLAPDKTEVLLMKGKRRRDHIAFSLDGVILKPAKTVTYLGVTLDERGSFGQHVKNAVSKAEQKGARLARLMPNIRGPTSGKRVVLCSAVQNLLLYGAPIWSRVMEIGKYKRILERAQRGMLLRVVSAYKTSSLEALQVIAAVTPIDLMVRERAYIYDRRREDRQLVTSQAKNNTIAEWQSKWDALSNKAQWTKRLIGRLDAWIACKHRQIDYYLCQALTGHGVFRVFAKRINRDTHDECIYCGCPDTPEHTIFDCSRWREHRTVPFKTIGRALTPETLVSTMEESPSTWKLVHNMIRDIMTRKEADEFHRQRHRPQ